MTDFTRQREDLIENYVAPVVKDRRILEAIRRVPREEFVPPEWASVAYQDTPLPIGEGQTISQPSLVAQMTVALDPQPTDKVLEIGTGSGYQAAILAQLVDKVYTVERLESLAKRAKWVLKKLGYDNVYLRVGDGSKGWPEHAPFDGIIVTAAAPQVPPPLVDQLAEGGRLVVPVGARWVQELVLGVKKGGKLLTQKTIPVRFVPLVGKYGWQNN